MPMEDLLRPALDLASSQKPSSVQATGHYVQHVMLPALRQYFERSCAEINAGHQLDEADTPEVKVVHYMSLATIYSMIDGQRKWILSQEEDSDKHVGDDVHSSTAPAPSSEERRPSYRLYDSVHFNDPGEGAYLVDELHDSYRWLDEYDTHLAYIASFILPTSPQDITEVADDLVFWRTYGREGQGCSVSLTVPWDRLRRVMYDPEDVTRSLQLLQSALGALDSLIEVANTFEAPVIAEVRRYMATVIWEALGEIRYLYKRQSYGYERECRIIVPSSSIEGTNQVRYTYSPAGSVGVIKHYYEDPTLPLTSLFGSDTIVTVGPAVGNAADVCRAIKALLRQAKLNGTVKRSTIQYRQAF